jgi:GNAT superfamily N-acetyltransferase
MGVTDVALEIDELSRADAPAGLALSDEAGWNQTIEDWRYFLQHGTVFGMHEAAGRVIATAALLPSPPVTWISMVLVTASWRRRGLANALMTRCIDTARARDLEAWLDATPAGAGVYSPMGFAETGTSLARLRRTSDPASSTAMRGSLDASLRRLFDADRQAMGFDRSELIRNFAERTGSRVHETDNAAGLVRAGRKARQIGPLYAANENGAIALLDRILTEEAGSLLIDLSAGHAGVRDFLLSRGFVFERPFSRMRLGAGTRTAARGCAGLIAVAGPEFG